MEAVWNAQPLQPPKNLKALGMMTEQMSHHVFNSSMFLSSQVINHTTCFIHRRSGSCWALVSLSPRAWRSVRLCSSDGRIRFPTFQNLGKSTDFSESRKGGVYHFFLGDKYRYKRYFMVRKRVWPGWRWKKSRLVTAVVLGSKKQR